MKILKESFIKESYGPKTQTRHEMWEDGYDIEGETGVFAQGTFTDGVDFDIVTDSSSDYAEINAFPEDIDENVILRVDNCTSEDTVKNLLSELERMTMNDAKNKYKSIFESTQKEDTVKTKDGKWVNKGKEGTHGEFDTKKQADAQRKAMYANGFKG